MNFRSILQLKSTHHLKKVSYRMLWKLHRLENTHSIENFHKFGDEYCVILYLQHMIETIEGVYKKKGIDVERIIKYLIRIVMLLKVKTKEDLKIHRSLLVSCLRRHTRVFNWLEENKISIATDDGLRKLWSLKCVPAYAGQFENRI